jgi:hypothetical protein
VDSRSWAVGSRNLSSENTGYNHIMTEVSRDFPQSLPCLELPPITLFLSLLILSFPVIEPFDTMQSVQIIECYYHIRPNIRLFVSQILLLRKEGSPYFRVLRNKYEKDDCEL